jgi:hypothetical protein
MVGRRWASWRRWELRRDLGEKTADGWDVEERGEADAWAKAC